MQLKRVNVPHAVSPTALLLCTNRWGSAPLDAQTISVCQQARGKCSGDVRCCVSCVRLMMLLELQLSTG